MRSFIFAVAATALVASGTLATSGRAEAAPAGPEGLRTAADRLNIAEDAQYFYGGYSYCWFPDGWQGPGWYVCDYGPWVAGRWWGGPRGWHGWV